MNHLQIEHDRIRNPLRVCVNVFDVQVTKPPMMATHWPNSRNQTKPKQGTHAYRQCRSTFFAREGGILDEVTTTAHGLATLPLWLWTVMNWFVLVFFVVFALNFREDEMKKLKQYT